MKKLMLSLVIGLTPFLLIHSASAENASAPKVEKPAQSQKPSLTYYYLDG